MNHVAGLGYRCQSCGILLSKRYTETLCPACRKRQDELDEEARIAAGVQA